MPRENAPHSRRLLGLDSGHADGILLPRPRVQLHSLADVTLPGVFRSGRLARSSRTQSLDCSITAHRNLAVTRAMSSTTFLRATRIQFARHTLAIRFSVLWTQGSNLRSHKGPAPPPPSDRENIVTARRCEIGQRQTSLPGTSLMMVLVLQGSGAQTVENDITHQPQTGPFMSVYWLATPAKKSGSWGRHPIVVPRSLAATSQATGP